MGHDCVSPYNLTVHGLSKGSHMLELVAFGNRVNTFGMLHNCNHTEPWPGHPDSFRTKDAAWAYEYQLKPSGILISPVLSIKNKHLTGLKTKGGVGDAAPCV